MGNTHYTLPPDKTIESFKTQIIGTYMVLRYFTYLARLFDTLIFGTTICNIFSQWENVMNLYHDIFHVKIRSKVYSSFVYNFLNFELTY